MTGKNISCFVYAPSGLVSSGNPQAYIRIFVKDDKFRNQYGDAVDITASNSDRWLQLSLTVGSGGGMDADFAPNSINTLGVRIDLQNNSTFSYSGPVYIDECSIEYP